MSPRELANLIREGAKLRPQCTGLLFRDGGSCAIGAACEMLGFQYEECAGFGDAARHFGIGKLLREHLEVPSGLFEGIYERNDDGQTREEIADWLDTLEPDTKPDDAAAYAAFKATLFTPVPVGDTESLSPQMDKEKL